MKLLWILLVWPEPDSSAAGVRTFRLIQACARAGIEVCAASPAAPNSYEQALQSVGVKTCGIYPNDSRGDVLLKEFQPDVVVFDRFVMEEQFSFRVRELCPNALRILDTVDLHFLRRLRQRLVESGREAIHLTPVDFIQEEVYREVSSILRSDVTLLVSSAEEELLVEKLRIPPSLLERCSLFYDPPLSVRSFEERRNFVCIGTFRHPPNVDAFRVLRDELWPRIRKRLSGDDAELHIYGSYSRGELFREVSPVPGLVFRGKANESIETLSHYRINCAPLRFGAGLKGKVADGWAAGTPCVATAIAAEGMHDGYDFGGRIVDDLDAFADQAALLYRDRREWEKAALVGLNIVKTHFSHQKLGDFVPMVRRRVDSLREHRAAHFMGELLWYQKNRSTEYFSRWIEVKERYSRIQTSAKVESNSRSDF